MLEGGERAPQGLGGLVVVGSLRDVYRARGDGAGHLTQRERAGVAFGEGARCLELAPDLEVVDSLTHVRPGSP